MSPTIELTLHAFLFSTQNDPGSILEAGGARHFTSYIKARIYCERTVQPGREFFGSIAYQYNDMSMLRVFSESAICTSKKSKEGEK